MYQTSTQHQIDPNDKLKKEVRGVLGTEAKASPTLLYVQPKAKRKMDGYVALVDAEVGWMGFIKQFERKHDESGLILPSALVLDDVFLYEQEVSGGSVDSGIDEGFDLTEVLQKVMDMNRDPKELRFFAHSHANMGVYHSPTDTSQIDEWAVTGLDWFISHVQNKKGEVDCRLDIFTPFRVQVAVKEILMTDIEVDKSVEEEILSNVRVRQYNQWHKPNKHNNTNFSHKKHPKSAVGCVISDESKDPAHVSSADVGSLDKPVIRYRNKNVDGTSVNVRQEIVFGIIVHEAIAGSAAARWRGDMTTKERELHYKEYMSKNPLLTDPTMEQLENHQSRSIERSEQKKIEQQTGPGELSEPAASDPTPTPKEAKKSSRGKQNGKQQSKSSELKEVTEKDEKKESLSQTKEEQQESLIVVEEGQKPEVEAEEGNNVDVETEIQEAFETLGFSA